MSRRGNSKRGTKPKSQKPRRSRKARPAVFIATKGGSKDFGAGKSEEYRFRRQYPLLDDDVNSLIEFTRGVIKRKGFRKRNQWMFISLMIKALGGLYQKSFVDKKLNDDAEKFDIQWISTHTFSSLRQLKVRVLELVNEIVPFHLRDRPAWLLRVRITSFTPSNRTGIGKSRQK